MNHVDAIILGRLYSRPSWSKSLRHVKPRVTALVSAGLAKRVKPPTGGATNMVAITDAGIDAIEKHWEALGRPVPGVLAR